MVRNRQSLSLIGTISDHTDSLDRLRALHVPILAIRGLGSTETDRAIVGDIVANAPNATLLELPGDHACFLEHPDRFLAALEAHIANARQDAQHGRAGNGRG
jgi:pimeloyl-ACP methyl ester carboxylesterase